jgi:hypothetical protein
MTYAMSPRVNCRRSVKKLLRLLDRNVIRPSEQDQTPGGQGNPRVFTELSAQRIALAYTLMEIGLTPNDAARTADECHRPTGLLVVDAYSARVLPLAEFNLPIGAAIVDMHELNIRVSERLNLKENAT